MTKQDTLKKVMKALILIVVVFVSICVAEPYFSSDNYKKEYIEALEKKQQSATGLTVAAAGMATLLAAVPDDSTTPGAQQMANTASYWVVITSVLLFEKYLMGLSGFLVFRYLVPAACLLMVLNVLFERQALKAIACRILAFAICILMLVPASIEIDKRLDETYHTSDTIEEAVNSDESLESTSESEKKGFLENATGFIGGVTDSIKNLPEQGKRMLVKFMDGVAMLILTTCIIPVVVLLVIVLVGKSLIRSIGNEVHINDQDIRNIVKTMKHIPDLGK